MRAQAKRVRRAIVGLVVCLMAAVLVDGACKSASPSIFSEGIKQVANVLPRDGPLSQVDASKDAWDDRGEALEELSSVGLSGQDAKALDEFGSEVISLAGYQDLRINEAASVVGFTTCGSPVEAFAKVARALKERGWTVVPSGSETQGSFVKEEGNQNWVYMSCIPVGDTTSVVMQYASGERKEDVL